MPAHARVAQRRREYCSEEPVTYAAESGETLLGPNTLMLHGRTSLTPESNREVLRAWVA